MKFYLSAKSESQSHCELRSADLEIGSISRKEGRRRNGDYGLDRTAAEKSLTSVEASWEMIDHQKSIDFSPISDDDQILSVESAYTSSNFFYFQVRLIEIRSQLNGDCANICLRSRSAPFGLDAIFKRRSFQAVYGANAWRGCFANLHPVLGSGRACVIAPFFGFDPFSCRRRGRAINLKFLRLIQNHVRTFWHKFCQPNLTTLLPDRNRKTSFFPSFRSVCWPPQIQGQAGAEKQPSMMDKMIFFNQISSHVSFNKFYLFIRK